MHVRAASFAQSSRRCLDALDTRPLHSYTRPLTFVQQLFATIFHVPYEPPGKLARCNPQLCPYAEEVTVLGPEPSIPTRRSLTTLEAATTTTTATTRRSTLVNFAPFLGRGALSFAIARQADAVAQYAAWRAVVRAMAPDKMWSLVLNPNTPYSPVRDSHMRAINVDR